MDDRTLHLSLSWLLLPLALFLTVVGALASPRDAQGRPLLLLPDVKAVEDYRQATSSATTGMQLLDGEIAALLAGQNTSICLPNPGKRRLPSNMLCALPRRSTCRQLRRPWTD